MLNIQKISSRDNQKLKFIRSVREGRVADKIFIEGIRVCEEILKTNLKTQFICFNEKSLQNIRIKELVELLSEQQIELLEVEERIFENIAETKSSQGIVIIADKPLVGNMILEKNLTENSLLILLHQINNPANLGAILRTAEAVGVNGIITTKGTTDPFSPKAIRSALGANLRLPFWIKADYKEVIEWANLNNIESVCADVRSETSYLDIDWTVGKMLVLGSEGNGLTDFERNITSESLIIPMNNEVESLNVAVANGIILFEAKRQRDAQKKAG